MAAARDVTAGLDMDALARLLGVQNWEVLHMAATEIHQEFSYEATLEAYLPAREARGLAAGSRQHLVKEWDAEFGSIIAALGNATEMARQLGLPGDAGVRFYAIYIPC